MRDNMKITIEFDTNDPNFDQHDLWVVQNASKMWAIIHDMKQLCRAYWKYQDGTFLRDQPDNDLIDIIHKNHMVIDDFI